MSYEYKPNTQNVEQKATKIRQQIFISTSCGVGLVQQKLQIENKHCTKG